MVTRRRLDPEALYKQLRHALRHGARASRLVRFTPELVELVFPAEQHPELNIYDRALRIEHLVRQAVEEIGGSPGEAMAVVLCLTPGTLGTTLEARRQRAAELLGILPDTFRRERHEGALLWDVVVEVYALAIAMER